MSKKIQTPPSREVRLQDGVLIGPTESLAFDIYTGDAGSLANSMVKLELVVELQRSKAVEGFAWLLRRKLSESGYLVVSDIGDTVNEWHMDQILGIEHKPLSVVADEDVGA